MEVCEKFGRTGNVNIEKRVSRSNAVTEVSPHDSLRKLA
jgi:hypothetical protein